MTSFESKMDNIRSCFDEAKAERYPLVNLLLAEKDEYIKSLYLRMLCVLIRYSGEISDMQALYLRRLIAGIKAEQSFQEYIKLALDIDATDINEFIDAIKDDDLKYYFCVDGFIVLGVSDSTDKQYGLLANIIELLNTSPKELNYLAQVAKAIIEQDSNQIKTICEVAPDSINRLSFYQYLSEVYKGDIVTAIADTDEEFYLYSPNRGEVTHLTNNIFTAKRVVFENVKLNIEEDITFRGCQEVIMRNCNLEGYWNKFVFEEVRKVKIEKCEVSCFLDRFALFYSTDNVKIINNNFKYCGVMRDGDVTGGVIWLADKAPNSIMLVNNKLDCCYVARVSYKSDYWAKGVFVGNDRFWADGLLNKIDIIGNYFIRCRCINNAVGYGSYIYISRVRERNEENNVCVGSVKNIF